MIYIPETDKLYINHGLSISVVECQTEKVIKVLPYHAYRVEDVGGGKVMLSHSEHVFDTDEVTGTMTTLYVDQKLVLSGNLDNMSEKELEAKMNQILEDHKTLINITPEEELVESKELTSPDNHSKQK